MLRAFKDDIILYRSLGTPIVTMASSIKVNTLNPWKKTNSCNKSSPDTLSQANNLGTNPTHQCKPTDCNSAGNKHNTTTPKGGAKPSPVQCQKKYCRAVASNTLKHAQLDMGIFWVHNPKIRNREIFPWDLPQKVCIQFCCGGSECKRESETACPFLHCCSPEDLKLETIELIGSHFMTKKID